MTFGTENWNGVATDGGIFFEDMFTHVSTLLLTYLLTSTALALRGKNLRRTR